MSNRYPATCFRCGEMVEPNTGIIDFTTWEHKQHWPRAFIGKALVQHVACHDKFQGTFVHHIYQPAGRTPT